MSTDHTNPSAGEPVPRAPQTASPATAPRSLLDCRLIIVTGKGGCGKTTVATALALAAAEAGKRVALAETGLDEHCPQLIDPKAPNVGYEGRELRPGLEVLHIRPFDALVEYLGLQIGMQALVERGLRQPAFQQLLAAAPGWRELITLGKIYYMETLQRDAQRPEYDLIIVDAPASGHGLTFLDVPRVVQSAIRTGPLRRNAGNVEALILDPERTRLLPVSLAEELPVNETVELIERITEQVGVPIDRTVMNRVAPSPYGSADDARELEARLTKLGDDADASASAFEVLPSPDVMAQCCAWRRERFELGARYVEQLADRTSLPLFEVRDRLEGISGPETLLEIGRQLLGTTPAEGNARE